MNLVALVIIAALVTVLLAKTRKAGPAAISAVVTLCLLFATFPALGPAVSSGTAEFARQLGDASDRAADLPEAQP